MSAGTDEVHLWRWRYINERGQRVESSWHMSEREAAHYRDVDRIEGTLEIGSRRGRRVIVGAIAEQVHAGQHYECAWDLLRFGQLKVGTQEQAGTELAAWCRRVGLEASFQVRQVRDRGVVYVMLWPSSHSR